MAEWRRGSSGGCCPTDTTCGPGDRADRAHDLEHLAGCERADLHGPVERHVERAVRAVDDQVVDCPVPLGTDVDTTYGPGRIKGSVF